MRLNSVFLTMTMMGVITSGAQAAEVFNAKSMAMSGSGLAVADFSYGASLNPALGSNYDETDDFNINVNAGILGRDEDDLLDKADDLVDLLEDIDEDVLTLQDVQNVQSALEEIDMVTANAEAGANFQIAVPNKYLSTIFFATGSAYVGVTADYDPTDLNVLLESAILNQPFDSADLNSRVFAQGLLITEVGLNFSRIFKVADQKVSFGIAPKWQNLESIAYVATVADFDEDDFDADEFTNESDAFNLDLGVQTSYEHWSFGAVVKNVIEQEIDRAIVFIPGTETVYVEPLLTAGVGYKNDWVQASVDVDVNAVADYIINEDIQFARAGVEFDAWDTAQLRAGYRHDIKGTYDDTISIGFGLSPFDVTNLDLAFIYGENNTLGGSIQIGGSF